MVALPGHEQQLIEMQKSWDETRGTKVDGPVASYVFKSDGAQNEYTLVAVFRDRQTYQANASDPEQDAWYRNLRSHLAADPEWRDGEVVASSTY
jgi:quinol monooxygenase YgiN